YAIVFSQRSAEPELQTRTFRIDTKQFLATLGLSGSADSKELQAATVKFFSEAGIDLAQSGRGFFLSDHGGLLLRATEGELDAAERLLETSKTLTTTAVDSTIILKKKANM